MKRSRRTRRRRERTIGEALAKPRTKAERAAKEELEHSAARIAAEIRRREETLRDLANPTRFLPPGASAIENIKPLAEQIADALAARRPPPTKDDEAAFAEVREVKSHHKLDDRAACFHVAGLRGWNKENFYRRYLRRAK
jgi:hypothetical protein